MRKMYSESQLQRMMSDEAGKLDKVIPTGLGASGDELYLEHDGKRLESQENVHFKQLFGKHSLIGEGNIDLYYHTITFGSFHGILISSSQTPIDSPQDLFLLAAGKYVPGTNGGLLVGTSVSDTGSFCDGTKITWSTPISDKVTTI